MGSTPAAMRALTPGAVDVVAKPSGAISLNSADVATDLVHKIGIAPLRTCGRAALERSAGNVVAVILTGVCMGKIGAALSEIVGQVANPGDGQLAVGRQP